MQKLAQIKSFLVVHEISVGPNVSTILACPRQRKCLGKFLHSNFFAWFLVDS